MKVLAKPIKVITVVDEAGAITPVKFKIRNSDESSRIINIDKVLLFEKERFAGNIMYLYRCESCIDDMEKVYELKYELSTCKWMLWKM